jgi:hypothetical protein
MTAPWIYYVSPVVGLVGTMLTLGVLWGSLRTQVNHLKDEVDRLCKSLDRQDHLLTELHEEVRVRFAAQEASTRRRKRR